MLENRVHQTKSSVYPRPSRIRSQVSPLCCCSSSGSEYPAWLLAVAVEVSNNLYALYSLPVLRFKVDVLNQEEAASHPLVAYRSADISRHHPGSN